MSNVKNFVGFDVSKKFFDGCKIIDGKEQVKRFDYDADGLAEMIRWLPGDAHCVMEATGPYYLRLAFKLHSENFVVSVVNPLVIKRFSQMRLIRAKTDKADAKMIAAYGLTEQPECWNPPPAYMLTLQQCEALQNQLIKQRTALLCQKEAFSASVVMDKEIKLMLNRSIDHLDRQILLLTERMEMIIKQYHNEMLKNIVSIPGLGKKSAIMLIVLSGGFKKFSNYKQLSAYVGLCPRIFESGTSVKGKARICKMGMSKIRAMLYVCAWSAKKCNKACKELYDRLVEKGKSKRLALIAVANKLIKQAFAIATTNRPYDLNYPENICF